MSTIIEFTGSEYNERAFAAWAEVYDEQPNPLLVLEKRYLTRLLPGIRGKDVLDVGCGTGRWMQHLAALQPASLHGLDSSQEMLRIAASKQLQGTRLTQANLLALPVAKESADLVVCSFVLSYVEDLAQCSSELARVIGPNGDLFLSDMHPATAVSLGWKRRFNGPGLTQEMQVIQRSMEEIQNTFFANGFELVACIEPQFGEIEYEQFQKNGMESAWDQAVGMPAIYLLHFRRLRRVPFFVANKRNSHRLRLHDMRCALGPNELVAASISIEDDVLSSIVSIPSSSCSEAHITDTPSIDLSGYLLFPGFINAHDHLEFALFPRLGSPPYQNATQWATDIQENEAASIALHKQIPKDVRLWWGGIRNLLCGATTVCHHNPFDPTLQDEDYPIRVVAQYGWEHSPSFAKDIPGALQTTGKDEPFLIHACEGTDKEASEEFHSLDALNAIEQRSVLIHGLALDRTGIYLLNQRGASLIICPSSNHFLFGRTHTRECLLCVDRLALGTDSPLTAAGDLLDELRFAKLACGLGAEQLYSIITKAAADILRLRNGEGTLRPDSVADFVAVRHRSGTPAEILTELSWRDVELVIVGGCVHLASADIYERMPEVMRRNLTPVMVENELCWLQGPVITMLQAAERTLGKGNVHLGNLRISAAEV